MKREEHTSMEERKARRKEGGVEGKRAGKGMKKRKAAKGGEGEK